MYRLAFILILLIPAQAFAVAAYTDHTFAGSTLLNCCLDDDANAACDTASLTNVCEDGDWTPALFCGSKVTSVFWMMVEGGTASAQNIANCYVCLDPTGTLKETLRTTSPASIATCDSLADPFGTDFPLDGTAASPDTAFISSMAAAYFTCVLDCTNGGQTGCDASRIMVSCLEH